MKIEAGKYYRTRDGRKAGPMKGVAPRLGRFCYIDDTDVAWAEDGSFGIYSRPDDKDIISEWPSLTPHQLRTAEMIKVKQAYVDGEAVEFSHDGENWQNIEEPSFSATVEYRVAPAATPDTIDWSHVAPEFKWMARNSNGTAFLHECEPRILPANRWSSMASARVSHKSYQRGAYDWKDSLVKRQ